MAVGWGCPGGALPNRGGERQKTASASRRERILFFLGPDSLTSSPSHPPNSRTVLRRVVSLSTPVLPFFFFFNLISRVSYLYIVMLMSNSCGADGRGVSGSQSLWISLPITHLAPVAISPRALWWRRPLRRPLGAGAFAFFFFSRASSATYLSGPRMRPGGGRFLDSPEPPGFRSWGVSSLPLLILSTPARLPSFSGPHPSTPPPPSIGRSRLHLFPEYHFHSRLGLR